MKYLDEFRDPVIARKLADRIRQMEGGPWTVMEVCGGQTHSLIRSGIDQLLEGKVELIHGPGCPVCVTGTGLIDQAIEIASRPGVILCSFGDMLRVPGSKGSLLEARSKGADVRVVYSPLDAVQLAERNPDREVVFFAVGFETTAPATALAVLQADAKGLGNFFVLCAHVLVLPAMEAVLEAEGCRVQGFLAAGHVCTVTGFERYEAFAQRYRVPVVVTGFEPLDLLEGILWCVRMLSRGEYGVRNQYRRSVRRSGNPAAWAAVERVYEVCDREWRGFGWLPSSGLTLRDRYRGFDADCRFGIAAAPGESPSECRAGEVLQGLIKPHECPAFGTQCTPDTPLGAPMVSSEGACAAYYRYRRWKEEANT